MNYDFKRQALRNIYDKREAIIEEPLSPTAHRNRGLQLRSKIPRQQKIFEDRLASVVLDFSTKTDLDVGSVTEIAKERIETHQIVINFFK